MKVVLTPEIAPRSGVVLFRPGSGAMAAFCPGRVLVEPVPEHLQHLPSGVVPAAAQPLAEDEALLPFLTHKNVIAAAGGLAALDAALLRGYGCQYPHSNYHHHEMVTMRHAPGSIRVCWGCDNKLREQCTEFLASLARRNLIDFVICSVLRELAMDETHQLTLPELCWWAVRFGVADCLPEGMARKALRMPEEVIPTVYRESDIMPTVTATSIVQNKVEKASQSGYLQEMQEQQKSILTLAADPESPESFMLRPKRRRWENGEYIRWVKTQPCECCRRPADDPHHVIGHGMGGTATKAHDLFVFPLCRECHDKLHADVVAFEKKHGTQLELLFRFMDRSLAIGVITNY